MMKAIIFDLDGVIVSTDEYHYQAWKRLAEEEHIPYSREMNMLQRGVSRMESLEVMLKEICKSYTTEQKSEMAQRKNGYYVELIKNITSADILPGVSKFLGDCKNSRILCAIGSSSKNTAAILKGIGLYDFFDTIADGTMIKNSKPHPEVFLLAAEKLHVEPCYCIVVEDAEAGLKAAKAAGMIALAVGAAKGSPTADISVASLADIGATDLISGKMGTLL